MAYELNYKVKCPHCGYENKELIELNNKYPIHEAKRLYIVILKMADVIIFFTLN
jgi:hypothetical protein